MIVLGLCNLYLVHRAVKNIHHGGTEAWRTQKPFCISRHYFENHHQNMPFYSASPRLRGEKS